MEGERAVTRSEWGEIEPAVPGIQGITAPPPPDPQLLRPCSGVWTRCPPEAPSSAAASICPLGPSDWHLTLHSGPSSAPVLAQPHGSGRTQPPESHTGCCPFGGSYPGCSPHPASLVQHPKCLVPLILTLSFSACVAHPTPRFLEAILHPHPFSSDLCSSLHATDGSSYGPRTRFTESDATTG